MPEARSHTGGASPASLCRVLALLKGKEQVDVILSVQRPSLQHWDRGSSQPTQGLPAPQGVIVHLSPHKGVSTTLA